MSRGSEMSNSLVSNEDPISVFLSGSFPYIPELDSSLNEVLRIPQVVPHPFLHHIRIVSLQPPPTTPSWVSSTTSRRSSLFAVSQGCQRNQQPCVVTVHSPEQFSENPAEYVPVRLSSRPHQGSIFALTSYFDPISGSPRIISGDSNGQVFVSSTSPSSQSGRDGCLFELGDAPRIVRQIVVRSSNTILCDQKEEAGKKGAGVGTPPVVFVAGGPNGRICEYELNSKCDRFGDVVPVSRILRGHGSEVRGLGLAREDAVLVSCSLAESLTVWSVKGEGSNGSASTMMLERRPIQSVDLASSGCSLCVVGENSVVVGECGVVECFDLRQMRFPVWESSEIHDDDVNEILRWKRGGKRFSCISCSSDRSVKVWDASTGKVRMECWMDDKVTGMCLFWKAEEQKTRRKEEEETHRRISSVVRAAEEVEEREEGEEEGESVKNRRSTLSSELENQEDIDVEEETNDDEDPEEDSSRLGIRRGLAREEEEESPLIQNSGRLIFSLAILLGILFVLANYWWGL